MSAAKPSLRASQTGALLRMLQLQRDGAEQRQWQDPWKILVYDAYCRDIISPLLKVGDLRKQGITLHLLLDGEREAITDVPAIYFVQPTAVNVKRIGDDCARALYESYYLNFTPAVPRPLLEELAAATLESGSVSQVSRVVDQYLNFVSLEEHFFSLLLPQSYRVLHDPQTPDTAVESTIEQMVNGLFSAVVTLGAVPILRYPATGGPAQMVAEHLGRRLHDQLRAHPQLFSEGQSSGFQRPLLVICERSIDYAIMVQHAWSYCALCHDLLELKLNRVTIHEAPSEAEAASSQKTGKKKTYDLDADDAFWREHMGAAFQTVASDVDTKLGEYRQAMETINAGSKLDASDTGSLNSQTRALASFVDTQLPELQEKKRLIDAHMNIATELLGQIRARSIDSYYAIEEALMEGRSLSRDDKQTLPSLVTGDAGGTHEDRLRLLLLLTLHPGAVPSAEVQQHEESLAASGVDLRALSHLRQQLQAQLANAQALANAKRQGGDGAAEAGRGVFSNVMRLADQVGVGSVVGRGVSALAAGVKQLLPSRQETPLTRVVSALMDNRGTTPEEERHAYLDPKLGGDPEAMAGAGTGGGAASRSRNPYSHALVFVVGPGNYLEYQTLQQSAGGAAGGGAGSGAAAVLGSGHASGSGRTVTYGCSEVLTPQEFLGQMSALGGV